MDGVAPAFWLENCWRIVSNFEAHFNRWPGEDVPSCRGDPIAMISSFARFDGAADKSNRLPFALASYLKIVMAIGAAIESGMPSIDSFGLVLPEILFGSVKDPGYGRRRLYRNNERQLLQQLHHAGNV